jgi:NifU-like protein
VSFYPLKISERFHAPKNAGALDAANSTGMDAAFSCGSVVKLALFIDPESKAILAASFKTNGCGYMTATADFIAETVTGKKLVELHGLHDDVIKGWITAEFGGLPQSRAECVNAVISALHKSLADFRTQQLEDWNGEKVLICTCFGVSEETIERAIETGNLFTVDEVTDACNAGGGCGSCQPLIQEILDSHKAEML